MPLVLCVCCSFLSPCSSTDMPQPPKDDLYILPDEYKPSSRPKRSLLKSHRNEELNVETLVVVDRKMMENHGHGNITTYVLTVLNMVGLAFLKPRAYVCVCALVCACVLLYVSAFVYVPVCVLVYIMCLCSCVCVFVCLSLCVHTNASFISYL